MQELALGGLRPEPQRQLRRIAQQFKETGEAMLRARPELKPGTRLMRQWQGRSYDVLVLDDGFSWQGTRYRSLSAIARQITGTAWSGPLFFGLKPNGSTPAGRRQYWVQATLRWRAAMPQADPSRKRCAVYTRKSSEEGLQQNFNSLVAQREACEAYIRSQRNESWVLARAHYDDGGFRAAIWSGRRCKACSPISAPAGSSSSTTSTGGMGCLHGAQGGHGADNFGSLFPAIARRLFNFLILLVRAGRLELPRPLGQQILS
jgi:hypothetical protein